MGGSSSHLKQPKKPEEYTFNINFIIGNKPEGDAAPIQGINNNENSNKNNINVLIKREGNENKIIYKNDNPNINLEINGNKINASVTSQDQNKDNSIGINENKKSLLNPNIEGNNNATYRNNIDNNEKQKNNMNPKITKGQENEYNPFYGKYNLNNEQINTNKPNNDNNIERDNNNQMDNLSNKPNNDNNIERDNNNNQLDNNENNKENNSGNDNGNQFDIYKYYQKDINEKNNDNLNFGETVKNNDNNVEHNNDEDKLSMSQSVLWASFIDLNIKNNNDKQIIVQNLTNKLEEGFFPLYAKIDDNKPYFYYIKQESTLKSLLSAHLLKSGITLSGEEYNLYNNGNQLDQNCPINQINDLKIFSVIEIRKRK